MPEHTTRIGDFIAFTRDDLELVGKIIGWYDNRAGRTFVVEVAAEMSPRSSNGRFHVSELAARAVDHNPFQGIEQP